MNGCEARRERELRVHCNSYENLCNGRNMTPRTMYCQTSLCLRMQYRTTRRSPDLRCEHGDDEARLDSSMHVLRCAHADGRMDAADTDSYAADGRAHRLRQRGGEDERGKEGGEIQEGGREGGRGVRRPRPRPRRGDGPREEVNRKVGERSEGGRKTAVRQS